MRTDHSSLEADTGLLVERLGVVAPERDWELLELGIKNHFITGPGFNVQLGWPPFAPWWTDEDVLRCLPRKTEWWGRR